MNFSSPFKTGPALFRPPKHWTCHFEWRGLSYLPNNKSSEKVGDGFVSSLSEVSLLAELRFTQAMMSPFSLFSEDKLLMANFLLTGVVLHLFWEAFSGEEVQ